MPLDPGLERQASQLTPTQSLRLIADRKVLAVRTVSSVCMISTQNLCSLQDPLLNLSGDTWQSRTLIGCESGDVETPRTATEELGPLWKLVTKALKRQSRRLKKNKICVKPPTSLELRVTAEPLGGSLSFL